MPAQGRIAAIVGDAVGHGVASAAAMGQLRASIMTAVANDPTPGRTLTAADLFARRGADTLGATVGCVLLGPDRANQLRLRRAAPAGVAASDG